MKRIVQLLAFVTPFIPMTVLCMDIELSSSESRPSISCHINGYDETQSFKKCNINNDAIYPKKYDLQKTRYREIIISNETSKSIGAHFKGFGTDPQDQDYDISLKTIINAYSKKTFYLHDQDKKSGKYYFLYAHALMVRFLDDAHSEKHITNPLDFKSDKFIASEWIDEHKKIHLSLGAVINAADLSHMGFVR